ncbi:MAG: 5-bromo-4-chloroindolyl phosphate hydrolysis family protein [Azoarcus sp.]|jgi:hypothetical protein|nr:5-bromo-4-chloroindolyl phosphate hydrolysis family protein [Azoarcus sp.]
MFFDDETLGVSLLDRVGAFFKGVATRALVHLLALTSAIFVAQPDVTAASGLFDIFAFKFSVYAGLVCLVPWGMGRRADWLIPTGAGFALVLCWALLGIAVPYGLIWAGAATWLIRTLLRKGRLGWEMMAAPWLVIALHFSFAGHLSGVDMGVPLLVFLAVVALGWAGAVLYARYRSNAAQRAVVSGNPPSADAFQTAVDRALAGRIGTFRESAAALQDKAHKLPDRVRACVDGIVFGTERILLCMRDDPNDVVQGDRFLSRYLKAAHDLVDDYTRFAAQESARPDIADALCRSESLLDRLQKAFEEEHARLLKNDIVDFTAELNVLDKLLKMDGR